MTDPIRNLTGLIVVLALGACSSDAGRGLTKDAVEVAAETADADAAADALPDTPTDGPRELPPDQTAETPDTAETAEVAPEVTPDDTTSLGGFLDPCETGADCLSGLCLEHMGNSVCTIECVEECPEGWQCKPLSAGPDTIFACVSSFTHLCRPCNAAADCVSPQGIEDVCVALGPAGSFCGADCSGGTVCPEGFACQDATTVEGGKVTQCVPKWGECLCSEQAVKLGLTTTCFVENKDGKCMGKRSCGQGGLSPCDAPTPAGETCNGKDDDCDGPADEEAPCDDGDPCTLDSCDGEAGCGHEPLTGVACDDADVCTAGDHCDAGQCTGDPIACDDGDLCTDDKCDPLAGCVGEPNHAACDDGDPCTVKDECDQGQCAGFALSCDCQQDADCAVLEDGNLCNGTLVCDKSKVPYQCKVDPATVVTCPLPEGPNAFCLAAWCKPETGECSVGPTLDGYACDDGNPCTIGEKCWSGICYGTVPLNCNDGNWCTNDACDPASGCIHTDNTEPCYDGSLCTLGDKCASGVCMPGPMKPACDDGNLCNGLETCDPVAGCKPGVPMDCDDGDQCTIDACDQQTGECSHLPIDCDDENDCTNDDQCDPAVGCVHTIIEGPCEDQNFCTVDDMCVAGLCVGAKWGACDDGNACTTDLCDPVTGSCKYVPIDCDDGIPWTTDWCNVQTGACVHLEKQCSDDSKCTIESHDPVTGGCVFSPVDCDDKNPCTKDGCDPLWGCWNAPTQDCFGPDPCKIYGCDPETGDCFANPKDCDDGNNCTTGDYCDPATGGCVNVPAVCDDENPCTKDACDPKSGCAHAPMVKPCSDGDVCTTGDACVDGVCVATGLLACDDLNPCTDDSCDPLAGCFHADNSAACDDLDACTTVDVCEAGSCVGSIPPDCDDGNPCTDDSCDPLGGCVNNDNSAACDDGDACTLDDKCGGGSCQPGPGKLDCDDGNLCTDDSCDPLDGCQHADNVAACEDGDPCTLGDKCSGGTCHAGSPIACDDGNKCTLDTCLPGGGCTYTWSGPCTVQPGPDPGKDHVIGSVYNIDPNGTMDHIRAGGWGDNYYALLQFPLDGLPPQASKATIRMMGMNDNISPPQMYFDYNTSPWAENCSWGAQPGSTFLMYIPPSTVGQWYEIDITDLYNKWKSGVWPNYGVKFRSTATWNNYNGFWSSDYTDDPSLRPMLVVVPK